MRWPLLILLLELACSIDIIISKSIVAETSDLFVGVTSDWWTENDPSYGQKFGDAVRRKRCFRIS